MGSTEGEGTTPQTPMEITPRTHGEPQKPQNNKSKRKRGRPSKKNKDNDVIHTDESSNESITSVESNNMYSSLEDDNPGDIVQPSKRSRSIKPKIPPPIVVPNLKQAEINSKLENATIPPSILKRKLTSQGTKLFVNTNEQFKLLKDHLKSQEVKFFTYTLEEDKTTKFVLKKLPDMEIDEVRKSFNENGFDPTDIKKFTLKKPIYHGQMNYLVYFKKSAGIKLIDLQKRITGMNHYLVQFEHYRSYKNGPTQCRNCQKIGHNSSNCSLSARCLRCGSKHKSPECPHINPETNKIPEDKIKCANCHKQHPANYSKCEKRQEVIQIQNRRSTLNKNTPRYVIDHNTYNKNYPTLPKPPTPSQPIYNTSYALIMRPTRSQQQPDSKLFTPEQLFQIFNDIITVSFTCNSRSEQIQSLMQIYQKYTNNNYD